MRTHDWKIISSAQDMSGIMKVHKWVNMFSHLTLQSNDAQCLQPNEFLIEDEVFLLNFQMCCKHLWCSTSKEGFACEVNCEVFVCLFCFVFVFFIWCIAFSRSALKWHLIYQNWSPHSNLTIEKDQKFLFFSFQMFSCKAAHSCRVPLFAVLRHIYYKICSSTKNYIKI